MRQRPRDQSPQAFLEQQQAMKQSQIAKTMAKMSRSTVGTDALNNTMRPEYGGSAFNTNRDALRTSTPTVHSYDNNPGRDRHFGNSTVALKPRASLRFATSGTTGPPRKKTLGHTKSQSQSYLH